MKKLVILCLLFLTSVANGANILIDLQVRDIEGQPIENLVVNQASGVTSNKFLITDSDGRASASFEYDANATELLTFLINGNRITLTGANGSQGSLVVSYNQEEQLIDNVSYNGTYKITNQEITKSSNYYLLLTYIFFTLVLATILVVSRVFYMKAQIDIIKHNQKKIHI